METKDPPPTSPVPVAKDGTADEDWGIARAKEAAALFQSKRFSECAEVLSEILQRKGEDPSVLHNLIVTEYLSDSGSNPKKLLDALNKFKLESAGSNGSTDVSGFKGSSSSSHLLSAGNSNYEDDFDTSIVAVNKAVLMYQIREYSRARSLLEPLYENLEPVDETIALHVCLLLLDVALASQDASRVADIILYLERAFGVSSASQGDPTIIQHVPGSKVSTSGLALDANMSFQSVIANSSENPSTGSDDSIEYEKLMSTLGNSGENSELSSSSDIPKTTMDSLSAASDLKLDLQLFKVRLLLLTRNPKAAKREIKLAMNMTRGRDSSMALLLKSQVEFARGNYRKAIILLMTCNNKPELGLTSMFSNNLGCIYQKLGNDALSLMYFTKALKACSLNSDKSVKLDLFSRDRSLFIFYNCAVQYLACEKPLLAAKCFYKASLVLSTRPILWLRLAECCIMASEKGLLHVSDGLGDGLGAEEAKIAVVGKGNYRRLLLETKSGNRTLDMSAQDGVIGNDTRCRLSLPFARQCLWTALYLLNWHEANSSTAAALSSVCEQDDSDETASDGLKNSNHKTVPASEFRASGVATSPTGSNNDTKETKGHANANALLLHSSVSAFEDMLCEDNRRIKQAVLADLSYVELCLENPLKALRAAEALRMLPGCSKLYVFLSCVYGAEALCQLNRLKDAAELLSIYLLDNNTVSLPYTVATKGAWTSGKAADSEDFNNSVAAQNASADPKDIDFLDPEEARGLVYVAFATVNAMKRDLNQAVWFITKALSIIPNNPRAMLAAVYLDILLGKTHDALAKLKRCSHVRFHSGRVTLNSSQ